VNCMTYTNDPFINQYHNIAITKNDKYIVIRIQSDDSK